MFASPRNICTQNSAWVRRRSSARLSPGAGGGDRIGTGSASLGRYRSLNKLIRRSTERCFNKSATQSNALKSLQTYLKIKQHVVDIQINWSNKTRNNSQGIIQLDKYRNILLIIKLMNALKKFIFRKTICFNCFHFSYNIVSPKSRFTTIYY